MIDNKLSNKNNREVSFIIFKKLLKKVKKTSRLQIINLSTLRHIIDNKNLFIKITLIYSVISIVNSRTILVKRINTIKIKVKNQKEKTIDIVIYRILYISKCSENLLSESQLNEQRIEIIIKNGKKLIKKKRRLVTIATY